MEFEEVMKLLESYGTEQNRKVYSKHGAKIPMFGVSFAHLNELKKNIKQDHPLALNLWNSGNADARILATMIMDPHQVTEKQIDNWVKETDYYGLADELVKRVVFPSSYMEKKLENWIHSNDEWIGRAGWLLVNQKAMNPDSTPDSYFENLIKIIEKDIKISKNRKKEMMNSALIAIGIRNSHLKEIAIQAAERIGKVEVDHGETNCKTPFAIDYINKAFLRKKK